MMDHTISTIEILGNSYSTVLVDGGNKGAPILLFPDWEGCLTNYALRKASDLARRNCCRVLLTDIYGHTKQPVKYIGSAETFIKNQLQKPESLRLFLADALRMYASALNIPTQKLTVIGLCFGGSLAFECARTGIALNGVVSIHGTPSTTSPVNGIVSTRFLYIHGADDPLITYEQINMFISEMRASRNDWQMHLLGMTQHSFTKEEVGQNGHGSKFNQNSNNRAFKLSVAFLKESLTHDE